MTYLGFHPDLCVQEDPALLGDHPDQGNQVNLGLLATQCHLSGLVTEYKKVIIVYKRHLCRYPIAHTTETYKSQ